MNEITLDELYIAVGEGIIDPRQFLEMFKFWVSNPKLLPAVKEG
mgnify:CR=1 FL=1